MGAEANGDAAASPDDEESSSSDQEEEEGEEAGPMAVLVDVMLVRVPQPWAQHSSRVLCLHVSKTIHLMNICMRYL